MSETLLHSWIQLNEAYSSAPTLIRQTFDQLVSLQRLYASHTGDQDTVLFSIFFHDLVYDASQKDNEARSADAAVAYLQQTTFSSHKTAMVKGFIIATQTQVPKSGNISWRCPSSSVPAYFATPVNKQQEKILHQKF